MNQGVEPVACSSSEIYRISTDDSDVENRGDNQNAGVRRGLVVSNAAVADRNNMAAADDIRHIRIDPPEAIVRNIKRMECTAKNIENRLKAFERVKKVDDQTMQTVSDEIYQFCEDLKYFVRIIYQIQYLNVTLVTSAWTSTSNGQSVVPINRWDSMCRFFCLNRQQSDPVLAEYEARKKVILHLLEMLQQVLYRFLKIQTVHEKMLARCRQLLQAASTTVTTLTDTDEDDPNLPLLIACHAQRYANITTWLARVDTLEGVLSRTKRYAVDLRNNFAVLRDLILWDYNQAVSNAPPWSPTPREVSRALHYTGMDRNSMSPFRKRVWTVTVVLAVLIVILVAVTLLSLLRFHY